jgi:2'-5' RNA ligase
MENENYEYSCLMLDFKIDNWNKLLQKISPDIIYNDETKQFGLETNPHVTILYGFTGGKEIAEQIKEITERAKTAIKVKIKSISKFEGDEFDVLKFDVESDILTKLNKIFSDNFENVNDFPDYHPHITIGYIKKGNLNNTVIDLKDKNLFLESNSFSFSLAGTKKSIKWNNSKIENLIKGGKGDYAVIDNFEIDSLLDGLKVESEHTDNISEALEIVLDHLTENKEYYIKLKDAGLADELNDVK